MTRRSNDYYRQRRRERAPPRPAANPWIIIGWMLLGGVLAFVLGVIGCTGVLLSQ